MYRGPLAAPNTPNLSCSSSVFAYFGGEALAKPVPALGGYSRSEESSIGSQVHQSSLEEVSMTLETWEPQPVQDLWWQMPQIAGEHIMEFFENKSEN